MKKRKIISLILVILWMLLIFYLSSRTAINSTEQSNMFVNLIMNLFNLKNYYLISFIIRKLAHFTLYFILGILLYNFVISYNIKKYYVLIIGIIYSISDEIHQLFVIGRSCEIRDIIIDSLGIIISYLLVKKICKKKNK